jgi:hypothetical protein
LIFKQCFYHPECTLKPPKKGKCRVFLKKTKDGIKNNISVSDEDTIQLNYDGWKELLRDTDVDDLQ